MNVKRFLLHLAWQIQVSTSLEATRVIIAIVPAQTHSLPAHDDALYQSKWLEEIKVATQETDYRAFKLATIFQFLRDQIHKQEAPTEMPFATDNENSGLTFWLPSTVNSSTSLYTWPGCFDPFIGRVYHDDPGLERPFILKNADPGSRIFLCTRI